MSNGKINKRNLVMLSVITSVLIATAMPVFGYDNKNPASYIVQYIIPSDTSFSVLLCGSETQMNFNPANGSSKLVEAACQSKTTNIPWATITNTGNLNENFSTNLTTTNPSWVVLNIGSLSSMSDEIIATNTLSSPSGWINIAPGNSVQLYALANFTNAPQGTNSTGIKITS